MASTKPEAHPTESPHQEKKDGVHEGGDEQEGKDEESLTTILNVHQRSHLTVLLAAATATMRETITSNFDANATLSPDMASDPSMSEDDKIMNANVDPGSVDVAAHDRERKMMAAREKELSAPKMRELRDAALDWFDAWREGVIGRVGEVVNSKSEAKKQIDDPAAVEKKPEVKTTADKKIDPEEGPKSSEEEEKLGSDTLHELYPPVSTPLADLDEAKRILILHSMLLLLLSLEHYPSPSRILLLYLTTSLRLPLSVLNKDEEKTAQGLLEAAKQLSGTSEIEKKAAENQTARKWKVGLASVAGAAVIGISGGMAAPLVAAGVGSVMGGLGLGATAAAGYLGTVAGSTVIVGGLFGAYGGRMTGQMMDNYAREVQDFAFLPVHGSHRHQLSHKSEKGEEEAEEEVEEQDSNDRRLRVTIGISGWLTEKEEVVTPWRVIGHNSEVFALRWELESLMNLGNAITAMVSSAAWGYAQKEVISHTIFAEMMAAMWPIGLLKISRVVDNPFSVAKSRAEKAGAVLADALINRAQGERPVTLIGYSLGARVIYACLLSLAARRAFGLVESVVLIGAPLPSDSKDWRVLRSACAGRLVNVYSKNDYVLGFLYRTSSIQLGVAGLQPVRDVPGVENVDVSDHVSGHLRYRYLVGSILRKIGFEDVDVGEVELEEEALRKMDEEERKRAEAIKKRIPGVSKVEGQTSNDHDADEEAQKMEQSVREKTQFSLMQRGAELLRLGSGITGSGTGKASSPVDAEKTDAPPQDQRSYLGFAKQHWPFTTNSSNAASQGAAATDAAQKPETATPAKEVSEKDEKPRSYLEMASDKWKGSGSGTGEKENAADKGGAGATASQKSYLQSAAEQLRFKKQEQ